MPSPLRKSLQLGLIVLIVIGLGATLRRSLGIDLNPQGLREFALGLGPGAPILFVGIVALRSLLALPSQVVLIAAGLCFGTTLGAVVGGAGLTLSGMGIFFGARFAGRESIHKRMGPRFASALDLAGRRTGATVLAVGTAYPIAPLTPFHAAAGLTTMSVALFAASAFIGGSARAAIFSYFGNAITESDPIAIVSATLIGAAVIGVPLLFPRGRAWVKATLALPSAGTATEAAGATHETAQPDSHPVHGRNDPGADSDPHLGASRARPD